MTDMTVELMEITPSDAAEMLTMNVRNRKMSKNKVTAYAASMRAGRWNPGSQVMVSPDGIIVDGQHRLQAVVSSGLTQTFTVLWNTPIEYQDDVDTHAKRTIGGQLTIHGVQNAATAAALLRPTMRWLAGAPATLIFSSSAFSGAVTGYPTTREAVEFYVAHESAVTSAARAVKRVTSQIGGSANALGLLSFLAGEVDEGDRDDFFSRLATGGDIATGSPILVLRNRMIEDRGRRDKRRALQIFGESVKAWNAYRDGEEIHKLIWRGGGANPERLSTPR